MMSAQVRRNSRSEEHRSPSPPTQTEDVRQQLYSSLRKQGVIDKLKSEMRHKLIMELTAKRALQRPIQPMQGARSLALRAGDSLVADYLSRRNLEYTLSVFVPEAGLSKQKLLSSSELLELLHINPHSKFYKSLAAALQAADGFLWTFLRQLAERAASAQTEIAAQTDGPSGITGAALPLSERLSRIDHRYEEARGMEAAAGVVAFEERLQNYQREVEDRLRRSLAAEQERFRAGELAKMRQEERERQRLAAAEERRQLEAEHAERLRAVQERERSAAEAWRRQQEQWDREAHARRQAMLEEAEAARRREVAARREQEASERERRARDERHRAAEEAVRQREQLVKEQEATLEGRLAEERATIRLAEERRMMERWREVEAMEVRLKEEARLVETEKENVRHLKEEVLKRQALFDEMEVTDYSSLKQENAVLRSEIDALKTRLTEITQDYDRKMLKQDVQLRERMEQNAAERELQRTVERLQEEVRREKTLQHNVEQNMQQTLQKEMTAHQQVLQRYEAQSLQVKEMNQEIEDLRQQLQQTEYALNCELHRRPRPTGLTPRTPRGDLSSSRFGDTEECVAGPWGSARSLATPRWAKAADGGDDFDGGGVGFGVEDMEDIVAETKHRLRVLDEETENLQGAYRSFQHRLNNPVYGGIPLPTTVTTSKPFGDGGWQQSAGTAAVVAAGGAASENIALMPSARGNADKLFATATSSHLPRSQLPMEDLKFRPGSPRVVVVNGNGMDTAADLKVDPGLTGAHYSMGFDDHHNSPAVNFDLPDGEAADLPADTSHDVGSTGDQFGPVASGEGLEATTGPSLDETWRSAGGNSDAEEEEAVESDTEWEARRQRRAEEKAQREEEEWKAKERELAQLRNPDPANAAAKAEPAPPLEEKKAEDKEEKEELAIDPVMQKYMEMVRQRKAEEAAAAAAVSAAPVADPEPEVPEFDLEASEPLSEGAPRSAPKSESSRSDFW